MKAHSVIGRIDERRRIATMLESARAGQSAALLIEGEPGVGKTALLDDTVDQAAGLTVLRAKGVESEVDLPCGGLAQLAGRITDLVRYLPSPQRNALQAALALEDSPQPVSDRFAVGAGLLGLLALAARKSPLVVVVDDAHWLDGPTIDALHFAARRLDAEGILLLIGSREADRGRPWFDGVPRLALNGLDLPAAQQVLARHGVEDLSAERLSRLVKMTGGNPLALVELPRLMTLPELTGQIPEHHPPPVGSLLQVAYGRRLSSLPEKSQDALLVLALLDSADRRTVDACLNAFGTGIADLEPAEDALLISFSADGPVFNHPLIRSAVVQTVPPARRRKGHAAAAAALAGSTVPVDRARRAWHAAAAVTGFSEEAAVLLDQAAAQALQLAGHLSASLAWERAAELSPAEADRSRRLLAAAESAYNAGEADRARRLVDTLGHLQLDPETQCETARVAGLLETWAGHPREAYRRLTETASWAAADHPLSAARLLMEATVSAVLAGHTERALSTAARARALTEDRDAMLALASQLTEGFVRISRGESALGLPLIDLDDAVIAFVAADPNALTFASMLMFCRILVDEFGAAERLQQTVSDLATQTGAAGLMPFALASRAVVAYRRGSWEVALALASEATQLAVDTARVNDHIQALGLVALVEASRGQETEARKHLAEVRARAVTAGASAVEAQALTFTGLLELTLGRPGEAVVVLESARQICTDLGLLELAHWQWAPELCEAYVRLGRPADAQPVADLLDWHAARTDRPIVAALAARCHGLLLTGTEAEQCFTTALSWHDRAGRPFERARTQFCFGEQLRRAKQRTRAREQLESAWKTFRALGARPWEERCRAEIAATGVQLAPVRQGPAALLTPQELQVALIVAAGASNREAACRLFLSPKTVEYHLKHVYDKLATSRKALADTLQTSGVTG
jgi:ATP/maltotriose-dependent transcriptional regulator MalT